MVTDSAESEARGNEPESTFGDNAMAVETDVSMPIVANGFIIHINIILYIVRALASLPDNQEKAFHSFALKRKNCMAAGSRSIILKIMVKLHAFKICSYLRECTPKVVRLIQLLNRESSLTQGSV